MAGKAARRARLAPRARRSFWSFAAPLFLLAAIAMLLWRRYEGGAGGVIPDAWFDEVAFQAGETAFEGAFHRLRERLGDPDDPLYARLARPGAAETDIPDFTPSDWPPLDAIVKDFDPIDVYVTGSLKPTGPIAGALRDPREHAGRAELSCHVALGGFVRTFVESRDYRFVSASPPLAGRFTLAVLEAGAVNYNIVRGGADGTTAGARPLALDNGRAEELLDAGWILLGGGRVTLNLARGAAGDGEDFQLPPGLTREAFFPEQTRLLLRSSGGFWTGGAADPCFSRFPIPDGFRSSAFRLFGCASAGAEASPGLVYGDVWRRYLQGTAVAACPGRAAELPTPLPWTLERDRIPTTAGVAPFLFLSERFYRLYMSQAREEPYNRSFDVVAGEGETPAPLLLRGALRDAGIDPYPWNAGRITLRDEAGNELYSGAPETFDVTAELTHRATLAFDSSEVWLAWTAPLDGPARTHELRGVSLLSDPRVDLGRGGALTVTGSGVLACRGNVRLPETRVARQGVDLVWRTQFPLDTDSG